MSVLITRSRSARHGLEILITGTASDAHTWNLIFLQLHCEERGHRVTNLGPCVPDDLLVASCRRADPDLVVLSSVNGHGFADGMGAIASLRHQPDLAGIPVIIGGTLGTDGVADPARTCRLLEAGFAGVFDGGDLAGFDRLLEELAGRSELVAS